jgi:hypothetical protein
MKASRILNKIKEITIPYIALYSTLFQKKDEDITNDYKFDSSEPIVDYLLHDNLCYKIESLHKPPKTNAKTKTIAEQLKEDPQYNQDLSKATHAIQNGNYVLSSMSDHTKTGYNRDLCTELDVDFAIFEMESELEKMSNNDSLIPPIFQKEYLQTQKRVIAYKVALTK